jgi:hypothetical protein
MEIPLAKKKQLTIGNDRCIFRSTKAQTVLP